MYFYSLLSVQHPQTESGSDAPMQERFRGLEQAETNKSLRDFDPTCMLATVCPYCAAVCMSDPQLLNDLQKRSDLSDASWVEIRRSSQVGWLLSVLGFEGRKYKHKRDRPVMLSLTLTGSLRCMWPAEPKGFTVASKGEFKFSLSKSLMCSDFDIMLFEQFACQLFMSQRKRDGLSPQEMDPSP